MICDKCGAAAADGVTRCPECGEPLAPAAPAPVSPSVPAPVAVTAGAVAPASKRPAWLVPVVAILAVAVIAAAAYFLWIRPSNANASSPAGAVTRMMDAFAVYDAQGILDNATHASMTATDVAAFTKQAADAKKLAAGKPGLKDLKIIKTTVDATDKNTAVVQLSAQWLTDQAKGTYAQRQETLTVVFQDGKWQVKLFQ